MIFVIFLFKYFIFPLLIFFCFPPTLCLVMNMKSVWQATLELPQFKQLDNDLKTDVLIIGGGLSGILCAYMLEQEKIPYALVESDRICGSTSGNTTAKITSQHGLVYHKLLRRFGLEKARQYFRANEEALASYRSLCRNIDCDFEEKDSFIYSVDRAEKLEKEWNALQKLGAGADFVRHLPLPFPVAGAIRFADQAQFNPLKFVRGLVPGLNIYEHTAVRSFDGRSYHTNRGKITAEKTIVATHFPFLNKHGAYFLKLYQHRSYVIALENAQEIGGMYMDERKTGVSFRNYENLLLLGGGAHRTGKSGGSWEELESFARKYYPRARVKYRWAAQDCMSLDALPYIGQYSSGTPDLFVASGFNKWGITSSMVAAMMLLDLVQGKESQYKDLFSPSRSVLHPQLASNAFHAAAGLLTPRTPRCPHLGCALKWNPQEHSWDCSCHGSRFGQDGTLLNNPSTSGLRPGKLKNS